jgi:Zn-dependent peptidase ImmA (M78 family)
MAVSNAAFLMPPSSVLAAGLRNATVDRILRAKRTWDVAAVALAHRLNELDLLTEWGYRSVCVQLSRVGYRQSEPNGMVRESSQLLAKVFKGLREDGIRPADLAADIGISPSEVRAHVFGLTLTAVSSD